MNRTNNQYSSWNANGRFCQYRWQLPFNLILYMMYWANKMPTCEQKQLQERIYFLSFIKEAKQCILLSCTCHAVAHPIIFFEVERRRRRRTKIFTNKYMKTHISTQTILYENVGFKNCTNFTLSKHRELRFKRWTRL